MVCDGTLNQNSHRHLLSLSFHTGHNSVFGYNIPTAKASACGTPKIVHENGVSGGCLSRLRLV